MAEEYVISVVIEGSDKASAPVKSAGKSVDGLNTKLINTMVQLEGVASGMNQMVGGMNKMVGGLEKSEGKVLGLIQVNEKHVKTMRNVSTQMEIMIGPMEMLIAGLKLKTVVESSATISTLGYTGAVSAAATATWGFTYALLANPIGMIVVGALMLVGVMLALESKFGTVTWAVGQLSDAFTTLKELIDYILDQMDNLASKADVIADVLSFNPIEAASDLLGG